MKKSEVYKRIDGEQSHQNTGKHKRNPGVAEEILIMEEYLKRARKACVDSPGNVEPTLDIMRKIVATGIRCFSESWLSFSLLV